MAQAKTKSPATVVEETLSRLSNMLGEKKTKVEKSLEDTFGSAENVKQFADQLQAFAKVLYAKDSVSEDDNKSKKAKTVTVTVDDEFAGVWSVMSKNVENALKYEEIDLSDDVVACDWWLMSGADVQALSPERIVDISKRLTFNEQSFKVKNLINFVTKGVFGAVARVTKCKPEDWPEYCHNVFHKCQKSVEDYTTVASLVDEYPMLLHAGVAYTTILNHRERISTQLKMDDSAREKFASHSRSFLVNIGGVKRYLPEVHKGSLMQVRNEKGEMVKLTARATATFVPDYGKNFSKMQVCEDSAISDHVYTQKMHEQLETTAPDVPNFGLTQLRVPPRPAPDATRRPTTTGEAVDQIDQRLEQIRVRFTNAFAKNQPLGVFQGDMVEQDGLVQLRATLLTTPRATPYPADYPAIFPDVGAV